MVTVYDFQTHYAIKNLRDFCRCSDDAVSGIHKLKEKYTQVEQGIKAMEAHHQMFIHCLGAHMSRLDETLSYAQDCSQACELGTLEDMIEERDRLKRNSRH
ncbi:hypothetical protein V5T82_03600 [Magnetovibrio sp. PR-2]|uniref:hypothetical protein n=1 Tax=Magnetovibrio sp. PR-2 TaxID=3120356 RepID=UPI002FCDE995